MLSPEGKMGQTIMAKDYSSRFMDFLEYLRDRPTRGSAQEIAEAIGVDRKSIYRYRDQARAHGLTVDDTPGVFRYR